jgi:hypothetical protein
LRGSQAAAGIVQAGDGLHRHKARCGTICNLIVRSILRAKLLCFDDQAIDECLQVAIRNALPLNPAKPAANLPHKPVLPWRPEFGKRLAVFAASRGKAV